LLQFFAKTGPIFIYFKLFLFIPLIPVPKAIVPSGTLCGFWIQNRGEIQCGNSKPSLQSGCGPGYVFQSNFLSSSGWMGSCFKTEANNLLSPSVYCLFDSLLLFSLFLSFSSQVFLRSTFQPKPARFFFFFLRYSSHVFCLYLIL
jgi:hypothetical protein